MAGKNSLSEVFCALALSAGQAILEIRAKGITVAQKADSSPVTEADKRAESIILEGLEKFLPGISVVAEESVCNGCCPERLGDKFILVDPLDGTREFIAGSPDFTVNIALIENEVPVAGAVYQPSRGVLYAAEARSAWKAAVGMNGIAEPFEKIACRPYSAPPCIVASRSNRTAETEAFIARVEGATTCSIGSSLKFCLLAEGQADLYPRYGPTMEWDTAAGDAILRAAGGMVVTLDGAPLRYGKRHRSGEADFANPFFIAHTGSVDIAQWV